MVEERALRDGSYLASSGTTSRDHRPSSAVSAGAVPSPNIWHHPDTYEIENRAVDPEQGGAPEGTVLVAEHQVTGRGRLDRVWTSPPRAGLTPASPWSRLRGSADAAPSLSERRPTA